MLQKAQLKDIADVRSGHLFKNRFEDVEDGNIKVVQLRDVDDEGKLDLSSLYRVNLEKVMDRTLLMKGDVVFKAKSNKPVAAVVNDDVSNTIATSHFFIIRLQKDVLIPEYLAWFLNHDGAQQYFQKRARGSWIPMINKKILGELEVSIPELKIQKLIVKINNLLVREIELVDELKDARKRMIDAMLLKV